MSKYFALTIGPIDDTISSARTTREMWASSYMFSYLIKKIIEEIDNHKGIVNIVIPNCSKVDKGERFGAGIYPDRIIGTYEQDNIASQIEEAVDNIIAEFARNIFNSLVEKGKNEKKLTYHLSFSSEEISDYLHKYFRIYYFGIELGDKENISETLYKYLDALELTPRLLPCESFPETEITVREKDDKKSVTERKFKLKVSPLRLFTDFVNDSFLFEDGFGKRKDARIPTVVEISTTELERIDSKKYEKFKKLNQNSISEAWFVPKNDNDNSEEEALNSLRREFKDDIKKYHNYMAIVHADGDNIGRTIKSLKEKNSNKSEYTLLKDFSGQLSLFSVNAAERINDYGGIPVYMGGDDLFFFAPVVSILKSNNERQTIFDLINTIDSAFGAIDLFKDEKEKPSLSYGISIAYRKFPVYESRNKAHDLLFKKAKKVKGKNTIAVSLQMASGHDVEFEIQKGQNLFAEFNKLVRINTGVDANFINSLTYKLDSQKKIFWSICRNSDQLDNFFKNNFNENYDKTQPFFDAIKKFVLAISGTYQWKDGDTDENTLEMQAKVMNLLYGALRFVHFLNSKEKESL